MEKQKVLINNKEYTFIKDFKDDESIRKSYNSLAQRIHGINFEDWYQGGYWWSGYMPYSLMDGQEIVANVAASIMDCVVLGQTKRYIQIGTVMTDSEYRNQGLSRHLMDRILEDWKDKCDMIYLFANDSVLNFYPKFGFTVANQYQYSKAIASSDGSIKAEKLDMSLDKNRKLLMERAANSVQISKLSVVDNSGLTMFYCISFMKDEVYYLRELDAVVIAGFEGDALHLKDVFSESEVNLNDVIDAMGPLANKQAKRVVLGFTPNDVTEYDENLLEEEDLTFFVMGKDAELFRDNKLMFPLLSHA
jgi:predicted N-acetyltransferase YhbS